MSRCPEPKSDADVRSFGCVAMISTLHSVWFRPAVLGGFGGMSDRSLKLFHLLVSPLCEAVGEGSGTIPWRFPSAFEPFKHLVSRTRTTFGTYTLQATITCRTADPCHMHVHEPLGAVRLRWRRLLCSATIHLSYAATQILDTSTCMLGIRAHATTLPLI
jgi:hypothetical protein